MNGTGKKKSILLVSPAHAYRNMWTLKEVGKLLGKSVTQYPLALPTLASLTPGGWDVRLVDEEMEQVPCGATPDLVGITAIATNVRRAYEIADGFRARGIKVVMGGPYTTVSYETSLEHADAVVVGEAEDVWGELLADFEAGTLRRTYQSGRPPDIRRLPKPRWDLVDTRKIMCCNVQISRGCPNACDFCCVTRMFGRRQRYRDLECVVEEIRSLPLRQLSFVDDNLTTNRRYARELMLQIKPLGMSWSCLAGLGVADDESLLEDMAEAGCNSILIGFESLDPQGLASVHKKHVDPSRYPEAIKRIHRVGIHVVGAFIVGLDNDGPGVFDDILGFARGNDLSYVMLNMLTAFPGTALHERMKAEGRTYDMDPEYLNGMFPSVRHPGITARQMHDGYYRTLAELYSWQELGGKAMRVFRSGNFRRRSSGISLADKVRGTAKMLRVYLFTSDPSRRKLFLDLTGMGRKGVVPMEAVVEYLMFVAAANIWIDEHRMRQGEMFEAIRDKLGQQEPR